VAEASVADNKPDTNFGSKTTLEVDGSPEKISYIRFNVTGFSGALPSAPISLRVTNDSSFGETIYLPTVGQ